MERKSQNLEFTHKFCIKSEDCIEKRSLNLFNITRPTCASGGDIGGSSTTDTYRCNSKSSSFHNLSCNTNLSDEQFEDAEAGEMINGDDAKSSYGANLSKRFSKGGGAGGTGLNGGGSISGNKYNEVGAKLKSELSKYKKELKEYNNTTKDLEEKYLKINYELNEMQQKHDLFVANRKSNAKESESYSDSSTSSGSGSEFSLKRKYTQVFHRGSSFITMMPHPDDNSSTENGSCRGRNTPKPRSIEGVASATRRKRKSSMPTLEKHSCHSSHSVPAKRQSTHQHQHQMQSQQHQHQAQNHGLTQSHSQSHKRKPENKENEPPTITEGIAGGHTKAATNNLSCKSQAAGLKDIYKVLKNVLDTNQKSQIAPKGIDMKELQFTICNLQKEQAQFRTIIQQQQSCLHDYHSRCVKAQHIMQTQQLEIEKLHNNNHQLETEISTGIDQLRIKIDSKLRDVSHLPQMVRDEQSKSEKMSKENQALAERLRTLQAEAAQLKVKIEELGRRKAVTINRLKAAERDLKIFKNYNTALKHEKRKLHEELQKLKEQLEGVQHSSKRSLVRQREQTERQRRELQKRVFELELKLSRSQNSTTSLIQERDSLIAELQTQLNTLVHNFEVSQKHIRVLRRHIYSMSGGSVHSNTSRIITESV